eukprot:s6789_g4.t1
MKRPAACEETAERPAKKAKESPKEEEEEDEPEEEEQEAKEEAEQPPEKSPEPPEVVSKLVKVKDHWRPRFEALGKQDPRLELDHGHGPFNPYSGCFYIYGAKQERLDMVNQKYRTDFTARYLTAVNRQNGASLGWTKFDSLAKAPGAWHFAAVADLSQLGL